jgi:hypothetical protein
MNTGDVLCSPYQKNNNTFRHIAGFRYFPPIPQHIPVFGADG